MINSKKAAHIRGITGQYGSYLAKFLFSKSDEVNDIEKRAETLGWKNSIDEKAIISEGKDVDAIGRNSETDYAAVRVDKRYFRLTEVDQLLGESKKAFSKIGWGPNTSLNDLISEIIEKDKKEVLKESILLKKGFRSISPHD